SAVKLLEYCKRELEEEDIDVYIPGDVNFAESEEQTEKIFIFKSNLDDQLHEKEIVEASAAVVMMDAQVIQQEQLHMLVRTAITYEHPDYFALQVFNGLFGGLPSSKLFTEVREKKSLAYCVASQIEGHKGLMFVFSGIAPDSFQQTKDIILQQKNAMDQGEFTEAETEEAKALLISGLKETLDNAQGIVEFFY